MLIDFRKYPLLMLDKYPDKIGYAAKVIKALEDDEMHVMVIESIEDFYINLSESKNISGIILSWAFCKHLNHQFDDLVTHIKAINHQLPIFIMTHTQALHDTSINLLSNDVVFFAEYDPLDFVVGRIKKLVIDYFNTLLPPFFKALMNYTQAYKSSWHTPGHMGGTAFLKSPTGQVFYDFYGENLFRSDLSISAPELGSLLDHSGVNGEAEQFAASIFGADYSFFVTNGTSTANKMIVMSCVGRGDIVLVDRNCHKSLQHAITLSDAIPIYLKPTRNVYGIIGTIPVTEFSPESIDKKIKQSPLIQDKTLKPKIAIVTNSTYDGLIYHVKTIKDLLLKTQIPSLHFDEAWFAYAHFHPLYHDRHAMSQHHQKEHPTVFCSQSTHKLLAAFSQASMIHIKQGQLPFQFDLFNETYMMHSSTSPQYPMVASLDVATKMMEGDNGRQLLQDTIQTAIEFRQEFARIQEKYLENQDWFFDLWQPEQIINHSPPILENPKYWQLNPSDSWHGFKEITEEFTMLDPIKITILTPGISLDGRFQSLGIPGPILSKFLIHYGVVDEKTNLYSLLFLYSIGASKTNSMNLLNGLILFKQAFDANAPVAELFPDLVTAYPRVYKNLRLKHLCKLMHQYFKEHDASKLLMNAFEVLPKQCLTPNQAYQHLIKGDCVAYPIKELKDKIILTMLAPYPPGIPIIMPGESIQGEHEEIISYLRLLERFDNNFPGFENEVEGVLIRTVRGKRQYWVNCLPSSN